MDPIAVLDFNACRKETADELRLSHLVPFDDGFSWKIENASRVGDIDAVQALLQELSSRNPAWVQGGLGPGGSIRLATENQHYAVVELFLSSGLPVDMGLVEIATTKRDTRMLDLFLAYGWQINEQMQWTFPPALALAVEDYELTAWFLNHGANPNARCQLDLTPLSVAIRYASFNVIELLFDRGGLIQYGCLLHHAIRRDLQDRLDIVRYLLSKGAGAFVNHVMGEGYGNAFQLEAALGLGTPLHEAAEYGRLELIQLLIENGANIYAMDSLGKTPLQRAQSAGHIGAVRFLESLM